MSTATKKSKKSTRPKPAEKIPPDHFVVRIKAVQDEPESKFIGWFYDPTGHTVEELAAAATFAARDAAEAHAQTYGVEDDELEVVRVRDLSTYVVWSEKDAAFFADGETFNSGFTDDLSLASRYTAAEADKLRLEYNPEREETGVMTVDEAEAFLAARAASTPEFIPAPAVQGELLPPEAGAPAPVPGELVGLQIESPVEAKMTALALSEHADTLSTLAKKLTEAGQEKEAAVLSANARVIKERLLPQLEPQAALPFGYESVSQALRDRIAGRIRRQLRARLTEATPRHEGESVADRDARVDDRLSEFEALVGSVAEIVVPMIEPALVDAASRGEVAGRHARETTPAALALEALAAQEAA